MAIGEPSGELIGAGRSAEVYAIGSDRVVRRSRAPQDAQADAELMAYLERAGYPVPKVYDADGADLVMERLDGRDMQSDLIRRPLLARQHARTLAGLHDQLHSITAPAGLRADHGPGDKVLHLDLQPANVMLTSRGPVVIDWTTAQAGPPGADVAMAYLIMGRSPLGQVPAAIRPILNSVRSILTGQFLLAVQDDPAPHLGEAIG